MCHPRSDESGRRCRHLPIRSCNAETSFGILRFVMSPRSTFVSQWINADGDDLRLRFSIQCLISPLASQFGRCRRRRCSPCLRKEPLHYSHPLVKVDFASLVRRLNSGASVAPKLSITEVVKTLLHTPPLSRRVTHEQKLEIFNPQKLHMNLRPTALEDTRP